MLLTPSPVTDCHTFSDLFPLECDVLYGVLLYVIPRKSIVYVTTAVDK